MSSHFMNLTGTLNNTFSIGTGENMTSFSTTATMLLVDKQIQMMGSNVLTETGVATLTNKTFDAAGTGNVLSNVDTTHFASGVITTDIANATPADDTTLPSVKAVKTYVTGAVGSLAAGLEYKSVFDATAFNAAVAGSTATALDNASQGDFYKVNVAGTITLGAETLELNVGDMIIINKDVTGTPTKADIDKIDNTESIPTVFGRSGPITANAGDYTAEKITYNDASSGLEATNVQDAIDELDSSKMAKAPKLDAIAAFDATAGAVFQTGENTFEKRTLAEGNGIKVTNSDGIGGNPTIAIDPAVIASKSEILPISFVIASTGSDVTSVSSVAVGYLIEKVVVAITANYDSNLTITLPDDTVQTLMNPTVGTYEFYMYYIPTKISKTTVSIGTGTTGSGFVTTYYSNTLS